MSNSEISDSVLKDGQHGGEQNTLHCPSVLLTQFPITDVPLFDQIGDLCKRKFKDPPGCVGRVRSAGCKALGDHPSTLPPGDALSVSSCL
jgi:hypothetical protein